MIDQRILYSCVATLLLLATGLAAAPGPETADASARLYIREPGVYRVSYDELLEIGFVTLPVPSDHLAVSHRGEAVRIRALDGGDGLFEPGDHLEMIGEHLAGDGKFFHEYSKLNVYWLHLDPTLARRMPSRGAAGSANEGWSRLERRRHLEEDRLMIRLGSHEIGKAEESDLWFWAKLTHIDRQPFVVELELDDLDIAASRQPHLRFVFRGLSRLAQKSMPHHRVEASLNGQALGHLEWDGRSVAVLDLPRLDLTLFRPGLNRLELRVPQRTPPSASDPVVDVVMLDWVEITYPRRSLVAEDQVQLYLESTGALTGDLVLDTVPQSDLQIYTADGAYLETAITERAARDVVHHRFSVPPDAASFFVVRDAAFKRPERIELDRPSDLSDPGQQADYLMIAHERLLAASRPLAEAHRRRGLAVELIDVQDVYDEFGGGIVHPQAIRDFIAFAHQRWRAPAPRFVLLIGDASWDTKNATVDDANYANWTTQQLLVGDRFVARNTPVYPHGAELNNRNLIPTWVFASSQGHSASDNPFVTVDGDDFHPDLAIGRFPVTEPEEARAIIDKTIRYLEEPELGPWRRNILWITNESRGFQTASDQMAEAMEGHGFASEKVYPQPSETGNEEHQTRLQDAFNRGQLLVHFYGHGGRHIWRTGPPDFRKNHDLFTLEHVDQLVPNNKLALILSMTCYSAPFDHPNADSIGEKFLRVPERGAVAVFAASWRNSPSRAFSRQLLAELAVPGAAIGTAIVKAKQGTKNRTLVEMYNLLGDPAIALAMPSLTVAVEPSSSDDPSRVLATVNRRFKGRAVVDWLDETGRVVASRELAVAERFEVGLESPSEAAQTSAVRVYIWDEKTSLDGLGIWQRDRATPRRAEASAATPSSRP